MVKNLTVVLYTFNNESEVSACLSSMKNLHAEIIAVDLESTDKTVDMLKKENVKIYTHRFVTFVEPARNFGMEKAKTDWVFFIDADEQMTPELVDELNRIQEHSSGFTHFKVKRKEIFARKKWLEHGGWWPNYIIRLIHKPSFITWPEAIHSTPQIKGKTGFLEFPLLHYSQNDWSEIVSKTVRFENAEAELLYQAGRPVSTFIFFRKFSGELFRRLIRDKGYRDGQIGIIESIYQAYSKTITYIFVYEKKKTSRSL